MKDVSGVVPYYKGRESKKYVKEDMSTHNKWVIMQ